MKPSTKLPMFSMRNIICIVGFQCNTVKELLQMRSINSDFKEAVDNHLIDIWYASFNPVNVKHSFNILNSYVVFQLCEVLHKYTTITGMNLSPLFIRNICPKIDTLMVKYGYVDCFDPRGYVSMTRRDVVGGETPLVYSCYTQNYKRIQFLLENNATVNLSYHNGGGVYHVNS